MKWWKITGRCAGVGLLVFLCGFLVDRREQVRDSANQSMCNGQLCYIHTVMMEYHEEHGHFPPAFLPDKDGKPMHSWRVLLLKSLDRGTYDQYRFDEPWNSPHNRSLESRMPNCYGCPGDDERGPWETNYFVVMGEETVFPFDRTVRREDIRRPLDETILVVESTGQGIHWMEPRDLSFDRMSFHLNDASRPSLRSFHHVAPDGSLLHGVNVLMVRGDRHYLSPPLPDLRQMLLIK